MAKFSQTLELIDKATAPLKKIQNSYESATKGAQQAKITLDQVGDSFFKVTTAADGLNFTMDEISSQEFNRLKAELEGLTAPMDTLKESTEELKETIDDINEQTQNNSKGGFFSAITLSTLAIRGIDAIKKGIQNLFSWGAEQSKNKNLLYSMIGDADIAGAMFGHIKDVASDSTASVGQLTQAYQTFMSTTRNVKDLDRLVNITERLSMFDTTGQGFEGAAFSVKELASGDYTSLANRFNISRSQIQQLKIPELFKKGDIEGGIKQFETLLNQIGYTKEAAEQMSKDPTILWEQFTSNLKTKFADAMDSVMGRIGPFIERLQELVNTPGFDKFVNDIVVSLGIIFGMVSTIVYFLIDNWGNVSTILTIAIVLVGSFVSALILAEGAVLAYTTATGIMAGIQFIAQNGLWGTAKALWAKATATWTAKVAQDGLNGSMWASPITWVVAGIIAIVAMMIVWSEAAGYVGGTIAVLGAIVINAFINMWNLIATFAEFFVNVWIDPAYAFKKLWWDLKNIALGSLANMVEGMETFAGEFMKNINTSINFALSGINLLISGFNTLFGTDFGQIGFLDVNNIHSASQAIRNMIGEAPTSDANVWSAPRLDQISLSEAGQAGYDFGFGSAEWIKDKIGGIFGGDGLDKINSSIGDLPDVLPGSIGNPAYNKEVDISEESIKLMRDVANMRFVQNFVTVTPDVRFGDVTVHETADYREFAEGLVNELEEGLLTSASGVYE